MLRGPQTPGELRTNAERLHRFPDLGAVEAVLQGLAARAESAGGPLAVQLPRQSGSREQRWAHLLSGPVEALPAEPAAAARPRAGETVGAAEFAALKAEVAELRALVERLVRNPAPAAKPDQKPGHSPDEEAAVVPQSRRPTSGQCHPDRRDAAL
jgi:uncharacterized protein YceH (UPF0502 family)